MRHLESKLQQAMVKWFRLRHPDLMLFHIPNGGKRSPITARILKAEGVLPGVADLFLMHPNEKYNGLWIEVKTEKGRQSAHQKHFEKVSTREGYFYQVCKSLQEFNQLIDNYLNNAL